MNIQYWNKSDLSADDSARDLICRMRDDRFLSLVKEKIKKLIYEQYKNKQPLCDPPAGED